MPRLTKRKKQILEARTKAKWRREEEDTRERLLTEEEIAMEAVAREWEGLKRTVPEALASVGLKTIRRFARRSQRYMSAYRYDLTLKAAEYAVRKYKSHRRIPHGVIIDIDREMNEK